MLLNRKLLQARTLFHLTNIEAKLLGNVVLARRYFFLTHSKAAGGQKLKKYLQTMFRTRALMFTSQFYIRGTTSSPPQQKGLSFSQFSRAEGPLSFHTDRSSAS